VTEAGGLSILSQVLSVSSAKGGIGWEGVAGERVGHMLNKKQAMATRICSQKSACFATGKPGGGSSNPRGAASRERKSV
jgi:hypothetical protein